MDTNVIVKTSNGDVRGRIANGIASRLIERAADVSLKERRPLVLCVRETPLNKIHIRNMSLAADAGATIFPLIPAFYYHPPTLDAMAQEWIGARPLAEVLEKLNGAGVAAAPIYDNRQIVEMCKALSKQNSDLISRLDTPTPPAVGVEGMSAERTANPEENGLSLHSRQGENAQGTDARA